MTRMGKAAYPRNPCNPWFKEVKKSSWRPGGSVVKNISAPSPLHIVEKEPRIPQMTRMGTAVYPRNPCNPWFKEVKKSPWRLGGSKRRLGSSKSSSRLRVRSATPRGTGPAANQRFGNSKNTSWRPWCLGGSKPSSRTRGNSATGFTLIELLTVIFIIAILIAILLPALIGAVHQAYSTSTQAELNSVRAACLSYDAAFNAYPGPIDEATIAAGTATANGSAITGTQNMLIGLMGTLYTTQPTYPGAPATIPISITEPSGDPSPNPYPNPYVTTTLGSGPIDYSNGNLQKNSYLSPAVDDLMTYPPPPAATSNGLPTLYDTFPDGLPILYYRKVPGMPGTGGAPVWLNSTTNGGAPGSGAAFYLNSNLAYTSPGASPNYLIAAKNGTDYSEEYSSYNKSVNNPYGSPINALAATVVKHSLVPPGVSVVVPPYYNQPDMTVRGGFALIGAGPDHIYGQNLNPNAAGSGGVPPPSDDIVVFGGQ